MIAAAKQVGKEKKTIIYFFTALTGLLSVFGFIVGIIGVVAAIAGIGSSLENELVFYVSISMIGSSIFLGILYEMSMSLKKMAGN